MTVTKGICECCGQPIPAPFVYIGIDSGANWGRYTSIDHDDVFEMLDYFDTLPARDIWGIELTERIEGPKEED